jgi:hypothetical protein
MELCAAFTTTYSSPSNIAILDKIHTYLSNPSYLHSLLGRRVVISCGGKQSEIFAESGLLENRAALIFNEKAKAALNGLFSTDPIYCDARNYTIIEERVCKTISQVMYFKHVVAIQSGSLEISQVEGVPLFAHRASHEKLKELGFSNLAEICRRDFHPILEEFNLTPSLNLFLQKIFNFDEEIVYGLKVEFFIKTDLPILNFIVEKKTDQSLHKSLRDLVIEYKFIISNLFKLFPNSSFKICQIQNREEGDIALYEEKIDLETGLVTKKKEGINEIEALLDLGFGYLYSLWAPPIYSEQGDFWVEHLIDLIASKKERVLPSLEHEQTPFSPFTAGSSTTLGSVAGSPYPTSYTPVPFLEMPEISYSGVVMTKLSKLRVSSEDEAICVMLAQLAKELFHHDRAIKARKITIYDKERLQLLLAIEPHIDSDSMAQVFLKSVKFLFSVIKKSSLETILVRDRQITESTDALFLHDRQITMSKGGDVATSEGVSTLKSEESYCLLDSEFAVFYARKSGQEAKEFTEFYKELELLAQG